ncbi:MAG TPA: glycosyltransferase family 4 protein [Bryobacteraceae bacterium]|nr:glycosyltransferase family 4 protein [Bryobacteraceae bacterium]
MSSPRPEPPAPAAPAPLRLAYLVSQYPAVNHTFILREIRELRRNGVDIAVISIRGADRPRSQLSAVEREEQNVTRVVLAAGALRIAACHLSALLRRPRRYFGGLFFALRLGGVRRGVRHALYFGEAVVVGEWMRRMRIAHLHSHFSTTVALLAARTFPITFSATIHGPAEFLDPNFHLPEKFAASRFLCAIGEYGRAEVLRLAGRTADRESQTRVEVARLGVDPAEFALPARTIRETGAPFEILMVGRLAAVKAPLLLLAAIRRVVAEGRTGVRLRWAGDGPLRREAEACISAHGLEPYVNLEGNCSADRVRALYRETDLFVLPSEAEGIPVVLMEAMAMEIPCVATRIAGIPELIRHGEDGWLVPAGDEAGLACAIAHLMDDPELRQRLGRAARERVIRDYNLAANVERLAGIFRRRLAGE